MKKLFYVVFLSCLGLFTAWGQNKPRIVDRPISFGPQRVLMTEQYMKERYLIEAPSGKIAPKMVVLHWTAIPSLEASFKAFDPEQLPAYRPELGRNGLNVSAHFLVDQDGTIYRLMPEDVMARHVIGLNHLAIGIENVGGTEETPLTPLQIKANAELLKYLKKKFPEIKYLIGHHQYTDLEGTELWKEIDPGYKTTKTDPGDRFVKLVKRKTRKLRWHPLPKPKQ